MAGFAETLMRLVPQVPDRIGRWPRLQVLVPLVSRR
jgi:hypothetical protein